MKYVLNMYIFYTGTVNLSYSPLAGEDMDAEENLLLLLY